MTSVTELDLPHLPVEGRDFSTDPMPYIEAARERHPWLATIHSGIFVHGYQAIRDLSLMDDKLRPSLDGVVSFYGADDTPWGRYQNDMIIALSGPRHTRIRGAVSKAFTPRTVGRFKPLMRERMSQLLDEWGPKGRFDFAELASLFPISVLCGLLGTSAEPVPRIKHLLETQALVFSLNPELRDALVDSYDQLAAFLDDLIAEREAAGPAGGGTLLDTLIETKNAGQIDDAELRYLLAVLYVAGYDTSKNMLTLTVHHLLDDPELWDRCAEEVAFCAKVIDESFRHTSTATVFRTAAEDFEYHGVTFPEGTRLFFANSLAGRDPAAFERPMDFDPDRLHAQHHVAFGRGAHICIGQHLARIQLTEGLHVVTQRLTHPRLAGEVEWRDYLGIWGLRTLPIETGLRPTGAG
jgi:cytochrome P450